MDDTLSVSLIAIVAVLAVTLIVAWSELYKLYRVYFANRRVLEDRRKFVIHDEFKDDRKADRRAR